MKYGINSINSGFDDIEAAEGGVHELVQFALDWYKKEMSDE